VAGKRQIGLWGATAIGIGGMVGGGIFAVLGVVATEARGGAALALLFAGVVALLTAFSYARLSVAYPSRGGSVVFVDRVFGISVATGALNSLLWFGYLVTLSLYAVAFGNYGATFFSGDGPPPVALRHGLISLGIVIPAVLNLLGAGIVAKAETAVVFIKLVMLAFVGTFAISTVQSSRLAVSTWPSIPGIVAAGMLVFVAYEGFELIANAAEDVRNPSRTLPRAFHLSVGLVIVLYIVIATITVGSLSSQQIASSSDFALAAAAKPSLGQAGFLIVAVSAVLATFSAINATLYGTARLSYSIASEGELPKTLERNVWSEPVGLLISTAAALLIANLLNVSEIASVASAVFLAVFGTVNAAALRARKRIGSGILSAGGGLAGCIVALVLLLGDTCRHRPVGMVVFVAAVVLVIMAETLWLRHRRTLRISPAGTGPGENGATGSGSR
jgi:amino acid transporter